MRIRDLAAVVLPLFVLILSTSEQTYACGCGSSDERLTTSEIAIRELNSSTAVFSGRVVRFEWRKRLSGASQIYTKDLPLKTKVAILKVDKWWKLELPIEVTLFTDEVVYANGTGGNSSCNYAFIKGKSYLVFANGPERELRANKCAPTNPIEGVSNELFDALGKGNEPTKKLKSGSRR